MFDPIVLDCKIQCDEIMNEDYEVLIITFFD